MKKLIQILTIVIALLVIACGKKDSAESKEKQLEKYKKEYAELESKIKVLEEEIAGSGNKEQRYKEVVVQPVKSGTFEHFIEVQGKVDSDKNIQVSPETGGVVMKIHVNVGDKVKKGQLLAELDPSYISRGIAEISSQLSFATNVYERQQRLWDQKVGTEMQYLTAKNNKENLERRLATLHRQYEMTRVKSPIDGAIDESRFKEGESVVPGMYMFRVVNLSEFKVIAELAESYLSNVQKGKDAILFFPDFNKEIKTVVSEKSNVIDITNRTFRVEFKLKSDNDMVMRPNMVAKVKINDYKNTVALTVPINTVQLSDNQKYIYLAEKGKSNLYQVKKQVVSEGVSYGDYVEIKEGLKEGDLLITVGYQDLVEGQNIKF